jgi:hypothetical protein
MNETMESYDTVYETEDVLADPLMHAHHHEMCLKDRERFDEELEEMRKENVELLQRIEQLEKTREGF